MELALHACRQGMQVRQAATQFKVPKSTLWNKCKGNAPTTSVGYSGYKSCLGDDVEQKLEERHACDQTSAVIHDNEASDDIYNNQTSGDHNIENSADIHAIQTSAVIHDNEFSDNIIYNNQTSGDHNIENSADIQAIQTSGVIHDNETAGDIYNNQTSGDHNIENSADIQTPADNHHIESFTLESDEINNTCNPSINSHNQTITRNKTSSAESNRQSTERDDPVSYNEPNLLTPNVSHTNRAMPIKNLNDFFKDILRYPATKNFPAKKKHLPSVLTCDEVLKHQTLKENLKKEADDLKMKKKEERTKKAEEKKKLQDLKKKTGKKGPNKVQSQPKKPILQNVVISESSSDEDSCTALPGNRDEIRKRGSRGLCFKCGNCINISEFAVPCMICSKIFHEKCVIEELDEQEDQTDLVFICTPCMDARSDSEISD
ncbi:hypothetical protein WDU94_001808 [Cyamophila willieti]